MAQNVLLKFLSEFSSVAEYKCNKSNLTLYLYINKEKLEIEI